MNEFSGALKKNGMILPMYGREAIFFDKDWNPSWKQEDNSIVLIFYDYFRKMYVVRPLEKMNVFMESGQPLGAKSYYIPRNTRLVINKENPALFL